ncbi:MAG: hypothetical protein LBL28_02065 [Treponema sp.]|nr:hypothetical protein [Treponema sp.]
MKTTVNKKIGLGMLVMVLAFGTVGCVTTPAADAVKLDFGGTLPPEILTYFDENQLMDIEAKFIVIQGGIQEFGLFGYQSVNTAILITVGKDYRIAQMSRYIKPSKDLGGNLTPGQHIRADSLSIIPNMATKYNTLQEAQLASEMGA